MKLNPRVVGNVLLGAAILSLLIGAVSTETTSAIGLGLGFSLLAVGLLLRIIAPDSRAKKRRGTALDAVASSLLGAILALGWWNRPVEALHHNDGGDLFAGFVYVPLAWMLITLPLLLFRIGMPAEDR